MVTRIIPLGVAGMEGIVLSSINYTRTASFNIQKVSEMVDAMEEHTIQPNVAGMAVTAKSSTKCIPIALLCFLIMLEMGCAMRDLK